MGCLDAARDEEGSGEPYPESGGISETFEPVVFVKEEDEAVAGGVGIDDCGSWCK